MSFKINKELKEFIEFKKTFKFEQKKIVQKGENFYCEDELILSANDDKPIGSSEKWINVGYKLKGPYSKVLSNLFPYEFWFKGKKLRSIESFFQGIKFKNKKMQNYILKYSGLDSNNIKVASDYDWKKYGIVYWQGKDIKRDSEEYERLVDELYISALQNPLYRNILKTCDRPVIHSIGELEKTKTVFTRYEFEYQINCLIKFLQKEN